MSARLAAEAKKAREQLTGRSQIASVGSSRSPDDILQAFLRSGDPSSRSKTGDDLKFQIRPAAEPANEQGGDRGAATRVGSARF